MTIEEILRLSLVKKTLDPADISDEEKQQMVLVAIRGMSDMLTLYDDDRYVIPKVPQNRTTIILRDLPENVKLQEIKTLLNNDVTRIEEIERTFLSFIERTFLPCAFLRVTQIY